MEITRTGDYSLSCEMYAFKGRLMEIGIL